MGTTVNSIHVYTLDPLSSSFGTFFSFSEGWQTFLPTESFTTDPAADQKLARRLSKQLPYPVLYFWEFDSDEFGFTLYLAGRQVTAFGTNGGAEGAKGLFKLPEQIGYPEGNKRRLSKILSCADIESAIGMLEEYFGVCLEVFIDLLDTPEELKRTRSDKLYRAYLEEEKRFTGKKAPIFVELSEEIFGIVEHNPVFADHSRPKKHIFYLAQFHSLMEIRTPLPAVEFRAGKLVPAEDPVVRNAEEITPLYDPRFQIEYYPKTAVTFSDEAPIPYRGKVFSSIPRGYYPFDFDPFDHLILINDRSGIAFMDSDGNLISKASVKGCLMDYHDGYFLTDKSALYRPWGWGFDPNGILRIYRIVYRN